MTAPTPSAPTAEMLAQEAKRLAHKMMEDSWATGDERAYHPARDEMHAVIDRLAALARSEPPTEGKIQAVATQRQPIVPEGWTIERRDSKPFRRIAIGAPNGYSAVVDSLARNPENILYMLAEALITAAPVASDRDSLVPASPIEAQAGAPKP